MKIVILDAYTENPGDLSWKALEQFGELTVYDRTPMNDEVEIIRRINYAEIVLTNKTPINARVIDACPSMKFISVLATGYNIVDYKYAAKKGITVSNVPAYGTASVAQFAIALLLEICHHIGHHNKSVHMGKWERSQDFCYWDYPLIELAGKTMGIIGFGRIGQSTGKIASALGMRVLAYDTLISDAGKHIAEYSLLPGYHIDQLREVWGKPDNSENSTACWKLGNDTTLVVSYKNNGIVAICGLKDDSGASIGE